MFLLLPLKSIATSLTVIVTCVCVYKCIHMPQHIHHTHIHHRHAPYTHTTHICTTHTYALTSHTHTTLTHLTHTPTHIHCTHTCIHTHHMCTHTLLHPPSVTSWHMFSGLTTWYWKTNYGLTPGKDQISLSQQPLIAYSSWPRSRLCKLTSVLFSMSIVQVLLRCHEASHSFLGDLVFQKTLWFSDSCTHSTPSSLMFP